MTFSRLWAMHLLWLVPMLVFLLAVQMRNKKRAMTMFADEDLIPRLAGQFKKSLSFLKGLFCAIALGCMIVALAGPRWGSHFEEVTQKGVDIMILLDVSRSMLTSDVKPSRLERAKREVIDLLRVVQGDRVGLVVFAGAAFVQCPLTLDYAALEMFVNSISPDIVPVQGTDLGAAIDTGISAFDMHSATDKVMILITDGEDNEGKGVDAARHAASMGIKIFVYGIGDTSGAPIPDEHGGFKKDKNGKLIMTRLNEEGLKKIAYLTGGGYVRSVEGDLDLDMLYFNGIKKKTEAKALKSGKIKVYEERFYIFLLPAMILLLLEGLIDPLKSSRQGINSTRSIFLLFLSLTTSIFLLLSTPCLAKGRPDPDRLYREGRYEEAEKIYAQEDMDHPKDVRYRYNRGCAAYKHSNFKGAKAAFESTAVRTRDKKILGMTLYNLGNTAFKMGNYSYAARCYKKALLYNPKDMDARHNLELTLLRMKKEKQKRQNKDNSQKQENDKNNKKEPGKKREEKDKKGKMSSKDQNTGTNGENKKKKQGKTNRTKQGTQGREKHEEQSNTLSGKLSANSEKGSSSYKQKRIPNPGTMDRKRAEALINNVRDNPGDFMRFNFETDKRMPSSGKDW